MHQLGLHELAEAVLGRARRRAGNKATALVGLMVQYQRRASLTRRRRWPCRFSARASGLGKPPRGCVSPTIPMPSAPRPSPSLARSGRLPQLIERARQEAKKTPRSVQIHQTLADYYTAAREPDKARAELLKLAELRPDDAGLRLDVANQLAREGQTAAALDHYKAAFRKDPTLAGSSFAQVENTFSRAGKTSELLDLLEEVDLRAIGTGSNLPRLIQRLPDDPKLSERIKSVYRRAWTTIPEQRYLLISQVIRDEIWQMPEMYDYAREVIIPKGPTGSSLDSWYPFLPFTLYASGATGGPMYQVRPTAIIRFLDLAARQGRLDELAGQIEAARKAFPEWTAGAAVLAMVRCRAGDFEQTGTLVPMLFDQIKKDPVASSSAYGLYACWAVGMELEKQAATREMATTVYERSLALPYALLLFRFQSDQLPALRLIDLYARDGRRDDARAALLRLAGTKSFPENMLDTVIKRYRMEALPVIARELVNLGFPGDAVPIFQEAIALADDPDISGLSVLGTAGSEQSRRQLCEDLNRAMNGYVARRAGKLRRPADRWCQGRCRPG